MFTFADIMNSIINNQKSSTSMKKLFALLVVAGMVFASCGGSQTEATVNEDATQEETVQQEEATQEEAVQMPEEEVAEEAPATEEAPAE